MVVIYKGGAWHVESGHAYKNIIIEKKGNSSVIPENQDIVSWIQTASFSVDGVCQRSDICIHKKA